MSPRRPALRVFWFFFAAVQLVLPGAASVADARIEAASVSALPTSHIEAHGGLHCPRIHPEDCALCQVLSATGTPARIATAPLVAALRVALPTDGSARVTQIGQRSARSRAPPAVA